MDISGERSSSSNTMLIYLITASSNAKIYSFSLVLHNTGFPVINCKFLSSASSRQSSSSLSKSPSSVSYASIRLSFKTIGQWTSEYNSQKSSTAKSFISGNKSDDTKAQSTTHIFTCTFPNTGVLTTATSTVLQKSNNLKP